MSAKTQRIRASWFQGPGRVQGQSLASRLVLNSRHPDQSCLHLNLSRGKTVVFGPLFERLSLRLLFSASLLLASAAFGQTFDSHLISDPAAPLYQKSSFAHGYRHGYEQGFHEADVDY